MYKVECQALRASAVISVVLANRAPLAESDVSGNYIMMPLFLSCFSSVSLQTGG